MLRASWELQTGTAEKVRFVAMSATRKFCLGETATWKNGLLTPGFCYF